jgi:hypothetical protein
MAIGNPGEEDGEREKRGGRRNVHEHGWSGKKAWERTRDGQERHKRETNRFGGKRSINKEKKSWDERAPATKSSKAN